MRSLAGSLWVWIGLLLFVGAVTMIGMNLSPQRSLLPSRDHGGAQAPVAATPLPAAPRAAGHPSQEYGAFRIPVQEVGGGAAQPSPLRLPDPPSETERRAVYDEAATVLLDGSLSHSDRRNRLRLVRRSFGDDLFFAVIRDVPVYDPGTGRTVTFADYMLDLAGTFVGHPQAPITFDPVGGATRIYFSPTEDTVRRMTGIGLADEQVHKYSAMYRGIEVEAEVTNGPPKLLQAGPLRPALRLPWDKTATPHRLRPEAVGNNIQSPSTRRMFPRRPSSPGTRNSGQPTIRPGEFSPTSTRPKSRAAGRCRLCSRTWGRRK